jgi:hypothetical protein
MSEDEPGKGGDGPMTATKKEFLSSDGSVGCIVVTRDDGEVFVYGDPNLRPPAETVGKSL